MGRFRGRGYALTGSSLLEKRQPGVCFSPPGIELKHLCLEYMTPWLLNLVRFCKHNDDAKRQRVTAILGKLITMTINEKQMYPSIQAKIWGSLGQVGPTLCLRGRFPRPPLTPLALSSDHRPAGRGAGQLHQDQRHRGTGFHQGRGHGRHRRGSGVGERQAGLQQGEGRLQLPGGWR